MADADKFSAALAAVREALSDCRVAPGEALHVEGLARSLRMSATPVRETLAYLSGAGVIERRTRGYRVRPLAPLDIVELERLHFAHVWIALEDPLDLDAGQMFSEPWQGLPNAEDASTYRGDIEAFWFGVTAGAGRHWPRLHSALRSISDQLAVVRAVEPVVLDQTRAELDSLTRLALRGEIEALKAAVVAYHRRRALAAVELSSELHWRPGRSKK